jgi:leucyl-tRNA synthetase
MVVAETWYREDADGRKHWFNPAEVEVSRDDKGILIGAVLKADGGPVLFGGIEKMSKSKNNGVDPEALIERYGADTVRLYTMFTSPPEQSLEWNDEGVEGASRFLKRVWTLAAVTADDIVAVDNAAEDDSAGVGAALNDARREMHVVLKRALFDYERQQFNTVVSACMSVVNILYKLDAASAGAHALRREGLGIVLRLLAPIAPHIAHHLWRELGFGEDILVSGWPEVDEAALRQDSIEYVVQVNGKVRGKVQVPADANAAVVEAAALANDNVRRFTQGVSVRKVIVVPNKLVNVVAK